MAGGQQRMTKAWAHGHDNKWGGHGLEMHQFWYVIFCLFFCTTYNYLQLDYDDGE